MVLELHGERREGWEVDDVAGERVEEADGGVLVSLEDQEALDGVENAVVREEREPDADEGPRVEVEEPDVLVEVFVAGVKAMALGEHHPAARVEAWVGHASAARRECDILLLQIDDGTVQQERSTSREFRCLGIWKQS
jgi:hypothetical protein